MIILILALIDGSHVNLKVPANFEVNVKTKYGVIHIPVADVLECRLSARPDSPNDLRSALKNMSSDKFKARDDAMKFLRKNQRDAYGFIKEAEKNATDSEASKRISDLLAEYKNPVPTKDFIRLKDDTFVSGFIVEKSIIGECSPIGKLDIGFGKIVSIMSKTDLSNVRIKPEDGWVKVSYISGERIDISASGCVDLFPSQPGQFTSSPSGYSGGTFEGYPSGSLLGRIGDKVFLVGNSLASNNMPSGHLELKINGSHWNVDATGGYLVTID